MTLWDAGLASTVSSCRSQRKTFGSALEGSFLSSISTLWWRYSVTGLCPLSPLGPLPWLLPVSICHSKLDLTGPRFLPFASCPRVSLLLWRQKKMQDLPGWPARLALARVCSPACLVPCVCICRRSGPKVGHQRPVGQTLTSARQAPAHKFSSLPPWCTALRCNSSDRMSPGLTDWATDCAGYETVASSPVPLPVFAPPLSPPHFLALTPASLRSHLPGKC